MPTLIINGQEVNNITLNGTDVKQISDGNILWQNENYRVATPVVSCTSNVVTMTCSTTGATIRYSTNGGSSWSNYSSAITISTTTTYLVYATKSGMFDSEQVSYTATFTIDYFAIKNETSSANTLTLTAKYNNGAPPKRTVNLDYSYDGVSFTSSNFSIPGGTADPTKTISIPANGTLYLRGNNTNGISFQDSNSKLQYIMFNCSGNFSIQGDIMTLVNKNGISANPSLVKYGFYYMFYGSKTLINAINCKLTAKTLIGYCYQGMFSGCSNLVNSPDIQATTLVSRSMYDMFRNCSKLNTIKVHFTSWDADSTYVWTYGTKSTGTFYKPSSLPSTKNASGNTTNPHYIPYNWTVTNI